MLEMRRFLAAVLLLALLLDFVQAEQEQSSDSRLQRPSLASVFLQRKISTAKKLEAQKSRIAQLQRRARAARQEQEQLMQQRRDGSEDVPAPAASGHPPPVSVDISGDPIFQQPHSRVDQWFDDPSGVKATLARMLISRQKLTAGSGEYAPPALSADTSFIHWVNSVTHNCYYNNDNPDRVFLDLELASGKVFGLCSRTGLRTCSFDADANTFTREHTCEPVRLQVQQTDVGSAALGCGDYDQLMPPSAHNGRQSLCTCANSWMNACHCVYELTTQQKEALCVGNRTPVTF